MATVAAVYTGQGLAETINTLFREVLPSHRLVNLMDDSIIHDVVREGGITRPVIRRLLEYYRIAADMGADLVVNTCSSVGEVAELGRQIVDIPILRIDEPMVLEAVGKYRNIGVLATLATTLGPTVRLLRSQAHRIEKEVSLTEGLADGAYHALVRGDPEGHDLLIEAEAQQVAEKADCILLAQGSMGRIRERLEAATGKPVLASPDLCLRHIASILGG